MSDHTAVSGETATFGWKRAAELIAAIVAWFWFILAGCGGFGLIITTGPWPPTHGWFAMFSGLAGWPVTAWVSKKYLRVTLSGRVRLGVAASVMLAGRLAVDFRTYSCCSLKRLPRPRSSTFSRNRNSA